MTWIWTTAVLVFLLIACMFARGASTDVKTKRARGTAVFVIGVVIIAWALINCFTTVAARSVGVGVAVGKYHGTYQSGPKFTEPWLSMNDFSTQVQYLELKGKDGEHDQKGTTPVNFKGGGRGDASVTVAWKINAPAAEQLWKDYKDFDRVRDRLVVSRARNAIRTALGGYTATGAQDGANVNLINASVKDAIQADVSSSGVIITGVTYDGIALDGKTQDSIESVLQAKQANEKALVDQERAKTEKATNDIRQNGGLLTDQAQRARCLDIAAGWDVGKQGAIPATWNCVVPLGGVGVVVNPGGK